MRRAVGDVHQALVEGLPTIWGHCHGASLQPWVVEDLDEAGTTVGGCDLVLHARLAAEAARLGAVGGGRELPRPGALRVGPHRGRR